MASTFEEMIIQELVRGIFTAAGIGGGAWMALWTYRRNQRWDSKHKTYQKAVKKLERLKDDLLHYRIALRDINNGGVVSPEAQAAFVKYKLAYLRTASDLRRLAQIGRFNIPEPARKILLQLCIAKLPESDHAGMLFLTSEAESATERFCEASHLDLQILTVFQRVGIAYSRLKQFTSWHGPRASYDLKRWGLILLHGEEKGKRLSNIALAALYRSKDAAK